MQEPLTLSENLLLFLQQTCEALLFIHSSGYIHSCLNPHIVSIISPHQAKLGGFEYMVNESRSHETHKFSITHEAIQDYYYHWLAPEILGKCVPVKQSDVYGMSVLVWETFSGAIPWEDKDAESVFKLVVGSKKNLELSPLVPDPLASLVRTGLIVSRIHEINP